MLLGLMGAMPEEMEQVIAAIENKEVIERGSRTYYKGQLYGQDVVAVFSRWGKVAAAATAVHLILEFNVDKIIFTGIAGAISSNLNIGDIVIGQRFFQHDMDARPLMQRFEIPLTKKTFFEIAENNVEQMTLAVRKFLDNSSDFKKELSKHGIESPHLLVGDIASGDLFISSKKMKQAIERNLPSVLCAEMEGAAVAQVCEDYNVTLSIIRVISDKADGEIDLSLSDFVNKHAGFYSLGILKEYIKGLTV